MRSLITIIMTLSLFACDQKEAVSSYTPQEEGEVADVDSSISGEDTGMDLTQEGWVKVVTGACHVEVVDWESWEIVYAFDVDATQDYDGPENPIAGDQFVEITCDTSEKDYGKIEVVFEEGRCTVVSTSEKIENVFILQAYNMPSGYRGDCTDDKIEVLTN